MFATIRPEIELTNIYPVILLTIALNSIEKKTSGMILQFALIYQSMQLASWEAHVRTWKINITNNKTNLKGH
jgi:hypothetical protein